MLPTSFIASSGLPPDAAKISWIISWLSGLATSHTQQSLDIRLLSSPSSSPRLPSLPRRLQQGSKIKGEIGGF